MRTIENTPSERDPAGDVLAGGRVVLDPPGGLLASDAANLVVSDETRCDAAGPDAAGDDD